MRRLSKLSLFFGLILIALSFSAGVWAANDNSSNAKFKQFKAPEISDSSKSAKNNKTIALTDRMEKRASQAANRVAKLSAARLRLCQAKEKVIENRFKALLALGVKTHTGKEKLVQRVDNFYNNVLVPEGHVLANYDALIADIAAKEEVVQEALAQAQANGEGFSCESDDPKGHADLFRQDIQALIAANRAYRVSVRAFVVAVRDLARQAKADTLSPSPAISPSVAPEVTEEPEL